MNKTTEINHAPRGNALIRYIKDVFTRPFRPLSLGEELSSLQMRNQERRRAITRLFSCFTGLVMLCIALPLALIQGLPFTTLGILFLIAGLGFGGLWLAERGFALIPALLFAVGGIIGATVFALVVGDITNPVLVGYDTFPVFIVIAGLVLPSWLLATTTAVGMVSTGILFAILPISPVFLNHQAQLGTGFQLLSLQLLTAILIWIAARSADSGIRETEAAYLRERDLARLQDQFITDANHELRTPIMAWFTSTELLAQHTVELPANRREKLLQRALHSGEQVLRLLDSIMDASSLEAQAPPLHPAFIDLAMIIREVAQSFDPTTAGEAGLKTEMAIERELHIAVPPDAQAWADDTRVRQVMTNLISNGMKYSAPGTPLDIAVTYEATARADPSVIISVHDYGLGIPSAEAVHIFDRFVRLERDIASTVRGTGVGLYLCRVFVEAMGGRIWVESTGIPGEGSRFCFTLPIAP
jgi:signal transduction histidine kinase